MEIRVLAYNEGKFILSKDVTAEWIKEKDLTINISPILKYREDDDIVGALLNIDYSFEGETLLFLGMIVTVFAESIKNLLNNSDKSDAKQALKPVWDVTLGMARGILADKTQGTPLENMILPLIDIEKFTELTAFVKEE